jgi:cell division cycle 20-like protein 1 (cofactor of APC complex)
MAWNGYVLSTGSRDHHILHRDVRQQAHFMSRLQGHRQEVCGLKWSYDEQQLASGGNDNKLYVWSLRSTSPVLKFNEHQAAVKAIAWSPHQHGLLASGGGTADRCIRFWNTVNNTPLSMVDTGSQVCNLIWSKNVNEIVSTHGYSLNQIILWKYPSMSKVTTLTGHTYRVLYLAISPDGQTIVTGAGDETLRFWNVFPSTKSRSGSGLSSANLPFGRTIR